MLNRYGIDELNKFLIKIYMFLLIIRLFFRFNFINCIIYIILFIFIFRLLSKNKFDRSRENRIYLDIKNNKFNINKYVNKRNKVNKKEYIYKRCKYCKKKLRLPIPKKRGIKSVICPNCKKRIKVLVLRKVDKYGKNN